MVSFVVPILNYGVFDCLTVKFSPLVTNPSPTFVVMVGRGTPYDVEAGFLPFPLMVFLEISLGRD